MKLLRIGDFGNAGVNIDAQPTMLSPGEWSFAQNLDIEAKNIRSARGDSFIAGTVPISPLYSFVFEGNDDTWLVISDGSSVFVTTGDGNWTDISPTSTEESSITWDTAANNFDVESNTWNEMETGGTPVTFAGVVTFTVFLGTLVVCPSQGIPCYWPDTVDRLEPLPNWPSAWRAQKLIAYTNVLVAIGLNNGVAGEKFRVGWSDFATEGLVPTQWIPASDNSAGSVLLQDSEGYLVTARQMRDNLMVYKKDQIYRMFPVADNRVFLFEAVITDHGCDSPNGIDAMGDLHFFVDRGDLRVFNGQTTQSVAYGRVKQELQLAVSNEYRDSTIVVCYPERDEVWLGVVQSGNSTVSFIWVYNMLENAWVPRSYSNIISMCRGPMPGINANNDGNSWSEQTKTWEEYTESWNNSTFEPTEEAVIMCSDNAIWKTDNGVGYADGSPKFCMAERTGFVFNNLKNKVTIKEVYPEIDGKGTVSVQVGWQWHANGEIHWTVPQTFAIGQDRKIRVRATGIPSGFRVWSTDDSSWRLGGLTFAVVDRGRR